MIWCYAGGPRQEKTRLVMSAFAKGFPGSKIIMGDPPDDGNPIAVYGQLWGAERLIPRAIESGRAFYQIDNGYFLPGRGGTRGFYRICYRSLSPVFLPNAPDVRTHLLRTPFKQWRKSGSHIVLALPGAGFGQAIGLNMSEWIKSAERKIRKRTHRRILIRAKGSIRPLGHDLRDAWAVVTHSSNVAVDAVIAGIPVFVEPTCPAAPVGNLSLDRIERPFMPNNREAWWRSLMAQQFTLSEMEQGAFIPVLESIRGMVDSPPAVAYA